MGGKMSGLVQRTSELQSRNHPTRNTGPAITSTFDLCFVTPLALGRAMFTATGVVSIMSRTLRTAHITLEAFGWSTALRAFVIHKAHLLQG